ncbi:hypothetical protein Taro_013217 [Colocasia esculenta]|uniref:SEC12-like protein 1 n=1 Tax=Colocasia esculenta TaxID=4460 RepID=A0A843UI29_COLES|nr:hypothetical protein [Colocasia esculenta]
MITLASSSGCPLEPNRRPPWPPPLSLSLLPSLSLILSFIRPCEDVACALGLKLEFLDQEKPKALNLAGLRLELELDSFVLNKLKLLSWCLVKSLDNSEAIIKKISMPSICRLFEVQGFVSDVNLLSKDLPPLRDAVRQKCLLFSTDGSKFACGGEVGTLHIIDDGHLRIFEWPSLQVILDEPKAHKSFRDMDISLDSEFLASTSTDGSARIWKISDSVPLTSLARNSDEKIECCRFSRDGTKPFLFCTIQKGNMVVTAVWDISNWNKIGIKRFLRKPISTLSISLDGKYLSLGSNDGDICVVEVKKMEICHWSKKLHLGTSVATIEFCPTERCVLSTSNQWGVTLTRLNVPADWKEWQIYLLLLGLFLASLVVFYIIYNNSDSFWNFPVGGDQPARPSLLKMSADDPHVTDDQSAW